MADDDLEAHVAAMLRALDPEPEREGLERTPQRVARALTFLTRGYREDPRKVINGALFTEPYAEMIVVSDIDFFSLPLTDISDIEIACKPIKREPPGVAESKAPDFWCASAHERIERVVIDTGRTSDGIETQQFSELRVHVLAVAVRISATSTIADWRRRWRRWRLWRRWGWRR